MSVARQIRVVLWKNFTIRRRRWPRVIFELIWPLFLFLILVWIRTRNLTFYYDACHNDPKYLGSTGFLPAVQSYICRWNNTCYNQSETTDQFNDNSSIWQQVLNFSESLSVLLNDDQFSTNLTRLFSQLNRLNDSTAVWNGSIWANKSSNDFNQSIPSSLFINPVNLSNLHQGWFMVKRRPTTSNFNVAVEIYARSRLRNDSYTYRPASRIQQAFCNNGQLNRTFFLNQTQWLEAKNILCVNLSSSDLKSFLISVQQQLDEIFLIQIQPRVSNFLAETSQIGQTIDQLRTRSDVLNVSFPFDESNFTLNSMCGGRNDLSGLFNQNASNSTAKEATGAAPTATVDGKASLSDVDWNNLATNLMYYDPSDVCPLYYSTGSGNVMQVAQVNRSCRCAVLDQFLRSNSALQSFATLLQPLLYGKIYYHPSNVQYDGLIKEMNRTFESLDELVILLRQIEAPLQSAEDTFQAICGDSLSTLSFCQQISAYRSSINLFIVLTEFIACSERNRFVPMASEAAMVSAGQNNSVTDTFFAAIEFLDDIADHQPLPKHLRYKIRMALDFVDTTFRTEDRYFSYQPRASAPFSTKYQSFGFIYLQNALERAIIKAHTGSNVSYGVQTQQMPYPCWLNDQFATAISRMLPLFMVLSWIFTVSMNVKDIVQEKEKRLKEIMRIMGLKDSVHWLTWFILCTTVMLFTAFILVLLLKFGKITQYSSFSLMIFFFVCYTFATISQCFLLSVFFNRANLAACGGGILFFLLYLPYTVLLNYDTQAKAWHKTIACFSSTVAFGLGCDYMARFEGMGKGIQWSNINQGAKPNDNYSFLYCLIMMLIDSLLYLLLTVYIENLFPGEFGIPQVWYFPVTKSYWFGFDPKKIQHSGKDISEDQKKKKHIHVEQDQGELGIHIDHLSKYYGNKMALKDLSVKFYRNMITAFLGRNGAGKSTTWSIITGLIPPSSGTVYIDGFDILTDIAVIRKRLGFAPQYNILFDLLTVKEHLEFFSRLKDAPEDSIAGETEKMLNDLNLEGKARNYSHELSGGMKRKLSIATAFIGNSTTVILDEPTAGVDPFARRAIWDLILKYKPGRTIVLSTHHLDEADLLSDRLAIISSGELQCVGTTMYLKRKYGEGYNFIVELTSRVPLAPGDLFISNDQRFNKLTDFIRTFMFDIRVKEQHGDQITYVILDDLEHTRIFPTMLADLDQNMEKYQIKTYGLSNSSLEQVFLRVADEIKRPEDYERPSSWKRFCRRLKIHTESGEPKEDGYPLEETLNTGLGGTMNSENWSSFTDERHTGVRHTAAQLQGLLVKRFHRTKRNVKGFIAEMLLPIIFVLLAMLVTKLAPNDSDPPPLILHPWYWGRPNYIFQSLPTNDVSSLSKSIQETYSQSPSLGTRCLRSTVFDTQQYPCAKNAIGDVNISTSPAVMEALNSVDYNQTRISPACDCWEKMQTCPVGSGGPAASFRLTENEDILYDLQGFNITDWAVKTEYNYEYLMKRFGGTEFLAREQFDGLQLFNETLIDQLINVTSSINQSSSYAIDAAKIAALFELAPPQVSVWYNNKGWPSSVAFVNIFNNALLRGLLLNSNTSVSIEDYGITAYNHPLPESDIQIDSELQTRAATELFTAICIIFALAFIPASFLVFLIDERVSTSKHLQFVSGLNGVTYWCGNFIWDLTNYCLSISCCMIIFLAFNIEAYVYRINFLCLLLLLFLYGFAIIPLMYPINYFFQTPSTGFVLVSCVNIFIGLITTISTYTLETFDDETDLQRVNAILMKLFLVFPHYCLGRGLFDMSRTHVLNEINQKYVANYVPVSPFEMDIVGRNLVSLTIQGVVFFLFALLVQYRFFIPDRGCVGFPKDLQSKTEDDDVAAERERIHADPNNTSGDVLRMVDLVKVYGWRWGKTFTAVKRTCVGMKTGECFGLLGINGSGKSTTFKMLTGEISMTDGNAYVNNHSVLKQLDQVHQNIGYCPQFDALDSLLTAREHLYFYARLRAIRQHNIPPLADCLLKRLGLTLWADRPVGQYSGGNKRKLSTAISLIGNPSIIFMDEPTTGMDVRAKRFLWDCILRLTREDHKSVVITSHSMEECETLCNRLVIMVNGEFQCLGSVQHLKAKFGDGYTILVRISQDSNRKTIIDSIQGHLPEACVKEEHNRMIHFRISTDVSLYKMFSVMEKVREQWSTMIEDYTVTQVTLDDVFVNFAKTQDDSQPIDQ